MNMISKIEELNKQKEELLNKFNLFAKQIDVIKTNIIRLEGAIGLLNEELKLEEDKKEKK